MSSLLSVKLSLPGTYSSKQKNATKLALNDFLQGLKKWPIWLLLAYQDIKIRYRRSILGPFWITLSMGITIGVMGFLYGHLFRTNLEEYFPYLAAGLLIWALLASLTTDLNDAFITSEALIKQIKLPYTLYIHRVISRNFIIFFHNLVVMVPIFIIFYHDAKINFHTLLFFVDLLVLYVNAFCYGMILAMIGARYRDVPQIVKTLIQVVFFITPVIWSPAILPEKYHIFILLNPFYAFVELIRAPLIGNLPSLMALLMATLVTILGLVWSSLLFIKYRSRIVYWL